MLSKPFRRPRPPVADRRQPSAVEKVGVNRAAFHKDRVPCSVGSSAPSPTAPNHSGHGKRGQTHSLTSLGVYGDSRFVSLDLENLENGMEEVYVGEAELGSQLHNILSPETRVTFISLAHVFGEPSGSKKSAVFKTKNKGVVQVHLKSQKDGPKANGPTLPLGPPLVLNVESWCPLSKSVSRPGYAKHAHRPVSPKSPLLAKPSITAQEEVSVKVHPPNPSSTLSMPVDDDGMASTSVLVLPGVWAAVDNP